MFAHPMGNFSVSHYARIEVGASGSKLTYVLDLAEMPTFEQLQRWGIPLRDATAVQIKAKAESQAGQWLSNVSIMQDGKSIHPQIRKLTAS